MSIKTQKIIRFIPFVNLLVIAIQWILFYQRNVVPNKMKRIIGNLLITAAACLILITVIESRNSGFRHYFDTKSQIW